MWCLLSRRLAGRPYVWGWLFFGRVRIMPGSRRVPSGTRRGHAALQPDARVASLLEETAAQAQRRGGAAAAARALERSAELSPDRGERARRLASAASAAVPTGQADWVQDLSARAIAVTAGPALQLPAP